jgi:hypothetical protein
MLAGDCCLNTVQMHQERNTASHDKGIWSRENGARTWPTMYWLTVLCGWHFGMNHES